jgi:uncharacterized damage-inducible protein DinB
MSGDDRGAIRAVLSLTIPYWQAIVERVPPEALERPAADGEWSALDCLQHLARGERLWGHRLRDFRDGSEEITPFVPDQDEDAAPTARELLATLAKRRDENMALLGELDTAPMALGIRHPERGKITLGQLLNAWAAHGFQHTMQAEEALMQLFIPQTGFWRPILADHDLEAKAGRT